MSDYYVYPRETWDEKKCERLSNKRRKDAYGSSRPAGLIVSQGEVRVNYGKTVTWNGGKVINGKWYKGEHMPLPKIPETFEFYHMSCWGMGLRKKDKKCA